MKDFFKQHGLWVLFAMAVISVALVVAAQFSTSSTLLENAVGTVLSPLRSSYIGISSWVDEKQNYFLDNQALVAENERLRLELSTMEEEIRQAQVDSAENERLRELLNLRAQRREFVFEAASITQRSVTNWISSLTLNRGTDHGIEVGNLVVTETGYLVGVIDSVGSNWSTLLTLVDTDTSLGAQVFRTQDLGLAQGDFSLMSEERLCLDFLPQEASLLAGDLIVTSGLGGYYPSGVTIGTVESVQTDDSGAASYAIIKPEADLNALSQVFVIKEFDIVD